MLRMDGEFRSPYKMQKQILRFTTPKLHPADLDLSAGTPEN
jgi:hypothetical protein